MAKKQDNPKPQNPFLDEYFLRHFIDIVDLDEEKKNLLLKKLPTYDQEEKKHLLTFLKDIYLLDLEEKQAIEEVSNHWA
ncbi:MAG: hypothetical protein NTW46_00760 [Candidatus Nealsonbacteria bacterium]|nr:hypothetical protein [Candidatus Nealsonbacteria bacterium]